MPADAVATAETELAEALEHDEAEQTDSESDVDPVDEDSEPGFWGEIGIDPIRIITGQGEFYSLRCYLDDDPVFLGSDGRIDVFGSPRALARFLAEGEALEDNDLARVATWPQVTQRATGGELEIEVDPDNSYVLTGLDDDLAAGPSEVDPNQLDLAEELLLDAATWADDKTVDEALQPSERLGWLVSFVLRPNPNRLPPSPPFDTEVEVWRELVAQFEDQRLRKH